MIWRLLIGEMSTQWIFSPGIFRREKKFVTLTFIKILYLNSSKMRIFVYEHNDDEGSKTLLGMTELLLSRNWLRSEVTLSLQP